MNIHLAHLSRRSKCLLAGLVLAPSFAQAGGFQLFEQSASSLGSYHSGGAAIADDASTAFFNAAGLTHIKSPQVSVTTALIFTKGSFKGDASRTTDGFPSIFDRNESGTDSIRGQKAVPALQVAAPINDDFYFGLDISVPFGLTTDWGTESIARYQATKSSIETINFGPSIAYKANEHFSIGAGPDIQYLRGDFNSMAGLGDSTINDTQGKNHVEGVGYGWHLGVLWDLTENTRFGLHYRSKVKHDADGDSRLVGPLAGAGEFAEGTARVKVELPATTTFSAFHQFNTQWDAMASIYYTKWSVIDQLKLTGVIGEGGNPTTVISTTDYRDTVTYAIGANYRPNKTWQFSAGLGYDESPVSNSHRDARLPDADRIATSVGVKYQATDSMHINFGYAHLFIKDNNIRSTSESGRQNATLDGKAKGDADLFALQLTWNL